MESIENISALMDGELDESEARRDVGRLKIDESLRERWDEFHLVRDAMLGEPLLSSRFGENFSRRLAEEPTVLAPQRSTSRARRLTTYAMSAAASVSAAVLVAWVALAPTAPEQLVRTTPAVPVEQVSLSSVPSDGRMNEYLLAHESFSPSTAWQGLAPYIRTVSATRQADGR